MIADGARRKTIRLQPVVRARPQRAAWWEDSDFVWWSRWMRARRAARQTLRKARRRGEC